MTRTGRPRPIETLRCPRCVPGQRCEAHRASRDSEAAARRSNGKSNGVPTRAVTWIADVPVPFVPVSTDLEGPPPTSSSMPPWATKSPTSPPSPPSPTASPPPQTVFEDSGGRSFHDAGPMLQRALLRKELERAVQTWMDIRQSMRESGAGHSPTALRKAEDDIERIGGALRRLA